MLSFALAGLSIQVGAQFFAISVVVTTLTASVPESLAMTSGAYPYDSSGFWGLTPNVNMLLLVLALLSNWRTRSRNRIGLSTACFVLSGVVAVALVEPLQASVLGGLQDGVTRAGLQAMANRWLKLDWLAWTCGAAGWVVLLSALLSARGGGRVESPTVAR